MGYCTEESHHHAEERHKFASKLTELKQQGAALFVVGNIPANKYTEACSKMLGNETVANRRRLFIATDSDLPSVTNRFTTDTSQFPSDTARLVTWGAKSRSAAVSTSTVESPMPTSQVSTASLGELGVAISEEIDEFETSPDDLDPAELRICFDSLQSLLCEYTQGSVFHFLHVLVGRVKNVQAMAHFHLPMAWKSKTVQLLSELFDATVELRIIDDRVQQRWHLRDSGITSVWLDL
jgi:hypothetical protein